MQRTHFLSRNVSFHDSSSSFLSRKRDSPKWSEKACPVCRIPFTYSRSWNSSSQQRVCVLLCSSKQKVLHERKYPQRGEGQCNGLGLPLGGYLWDAVLGSSLIHRSKLHFLISAYLGIKGQISFPICLAPFLKYLLVQNSRCYSLDFLKAKHLMRWTKTMEK